MRKTILSLILCLLATATWADEQKKVSLSGDNNKETVSLPFANIFVTMAGDDGENAKVDIELENLDESKVLILFDRSYTEKAVKKMSPSIIFDKTFGGTKGKRIIDATSLQVERVMQFRPSDKFQLPEITVANGEKQAVMLPIYIAKWKGNKKLILLEKQLIELDVEVELKPSAEFTGFSSDVKSIERQTICPNAKHSPKLATQKQRYQEKIDQLKKKIEDAIVAHNWHEGDSGYIRYMDLIDRLDAINVDSHTRDCGAHNDPDANKPQCGNCNLSLQQIYHKIDDLYKKIYTSSNRQATKQSVMGQVNMLYQCASTHKTHVTQWKRGGDYKTKIEERYNRIQRL